MAVVQTNGNGSAASVSTAVTMGSNVTQSNALIVVIACGAATISSVVDSSGNVYKAAYDATASNVRNALYYCRNINGSSAAPVVTVTFSGSVGNNIIVREYSGIDYRYNCDVFATATGTLSTPTVTSNVTSWANALVISTVSDFAGAPTAGAGYGNLTTQATTTPAAAIEDATISSIAAQTATFSASSSNWTQGIVVFKLIDTALTTPKINSGSRPAMFAPGQAR